MARVHLPVAANATAGPRRASIRSSRGCPADPISPSAPPRAFQRRDRVLFSRRAAAIDWPRGLRKYHAVRRSSSPDGGARKIDWRATDPFLPRGSESRPVGAGGAAFSRSIEGRGQKNRASLKGGLTRIPRNSAGALAGSCRRRVFRPGPTRRLLAVTGPVSHHQVVNRRQAHRTTGRAFLFLRVRLSLCFLPPPH